MLVIGITSRALFDLDESHKIFENERPPFYTVVPPVESSPMGSN